MARRQLRRTTEEYFGRARTSRAETIESSKLLLDIVRDLKRGQREPVSEFPASREFTGNFIEKEGG